MPVFHVPMRGRANLRNHRKLIVVDGRTSLTGGMNLALPYIGPPGSGPACGAISPWSSKVRPSPTSRRSSHRTGNSPRGSKPGPTRVRRRRPKPAEDGTATAQVVASGPDVAGDPLYESLLALIFGARDRIWIVTPYYVPDEMLSRALAPGGPSRGGRPADRADPFEPPHRRPGPRQLSPRPAQCRRAGAALYPRDAPRQGRASSTTSSPSSDRPTWTCGACSSTTRSRSSSGRRTRSRGSPPGPRV